MRRGTALLLLAPAVLLIAALLGAPLAWLVRFSVHAGQVGVVPSGALTLAHYAKALGDAFYLEVFARTLGMALVITLASTVVSYPLAHFMWQAPRRWRAALTILALSPLLVSIVVSSYGWMVILGDQGVVNQALRATGLASKPVKLMYTDLAIVVGLVHIVMPFMTLSILAALAHPLARDAAAGAAGHRRGHHHRLQPRDLRLCHARRARAERVELHHHAHLAAIHAAHELVLRLGARGAAAGALAGDRLRLHAAADRGGRLRRPGQGSGMTALHRLVVLLVAAFILAPIVVVVAVSLTDSPIPEFPPRGLTLRWYAHALSEDVFTTSALNSLWLATLATAIATPLALAAAYGLVRGRFRGRDAIQTLLLAPLVVPSLVIGLAILLAFSGMGVRDVGARLVGAHVLITFPYMVRTILASLARLDPAVEEAARTLGASALRCFVLVTLPLVRPGVVAGMLFAFIVSFDNVSLSLFLTNARTNTLPIAILNYVEYNFDPSVAAISTMLVAFSLGAALLVERLVGLRRVVGG